MEVHPPEHGIHTWRDFFVHMATICLGLLIAIALEQGVEALHHRHQRHQLEEDLRQEADQNLKLIEHDLRMQETEAWFVTAAAAEQDAVAQDGKVSLTLAAPPCLPGSVGTSEVRYFAPSEAVWTAAHDSGLLALLPTDQARLYARLEHNLELLGTVREQVYDGCNVISSMRQRFTHPAAGVEVWTMSPTQAEAFGTAAASTLIAIRGLTFRLRWTQLYESALARGEIEPDTKMIYMDQARFEDSNSR